MFTEYVRITPDVLWIPAYAGMTVMHRPIYSRTLRQTRVGAGLNPARARSHSSYSGPECSQINHSLRRSPVDKKGYDIFAAADVEPNLKAVGREAVFRGTQ